MANLTMRDRKMLRVGVLLAAWRVRNAPGTDWGPGFTAGDAFGDLLDDLPSEFGGEEVETEIQSLLAHEGVS